MPEPLDYENPKKSDAPESAIPFVRAPIPVEFDVSLSRTQDYAGAQAIEARLAREHIKVFRAEDGTDLNRWIELYVRAADHRKASEIAARIYARRRKLNSLPRQEVAPPAVHVDPRRGIAW